MKTTYIQDGVRYDAKGLLSTASQMPDKATIRMAILLSFHDINENDLSTDGLWIVKLMRPLFKMADAAEKKQILKAVLDM